MKKDRIQNGNVTVDANNGEINVFNISGDFVVKTNRRIDEG